MPRQKTRPLAALVDEATKDSDFALYVESILSDLECIEAHILGRKLQTEEQILSDLPPLIYLLKTASRNIPEGY